MATETYIKKFEDQLKELEQQTGKHFQLTLHEEGKYHDKGIIINSFKNRKYELYDMNPNFQKLAGIYDSYDDMMDAIVKFKLNFTEETKMYDDKLVWKCPKCKEWGRKFQGTSNKNFMNNLLTNILGGSDHSDMYMEDRENGIIFYNSSDDLCCQNCSFSEWSFNHITVDLHSGNVYTHGRGTLAICHNQGKVRII